MGRGLPRSSSKGNKHTRRKSSNNGGFLANGPFRPVASWLMSGSSVARMRRFAIISISIYALHSYASYVILQGEGSIAGGAFPRFSLGVQQIVNDKTGKTVGNLYERRVGVTYATNIGEQTRDIYAREVRPVEEATPGTAQESVLWVFLHGALHDSSIWVKNGISEMLASQGFRSLAMDMPGFGEVGDQKRVPANQMASYMEALRKTFDMEYVVVIAPVMAGKFALPWLMTTPDSFMGFVGIDIIETERYPDEQYQSITNIPVLLMYGERDQVGPTAEKKLSLCEKFQMKVIESFGTNWYQEKTRDLRKYLSEYAEAIVAHVDDINNRDLPPEERSSNVPEGEENAANPAAEGDPDSSFSLAQVQPPVPIE